MSADRIVRHAVKRAVVIGGGNTAIDAVRELLGLLRNGGVPEVTMVYRGEEAKMSGYAHEWSAAKVEGAKAQWRAQPLAFEGEGQLQRVRFAQLDANKQPIAGREFTVPADLALVAIGQAKLEHQLAGLAGLQFERGTVRVDAAQATTAPGVFAGGDCANGGKEVVNATAEGKRAAQSIHAYLTGGNGHA